MGSGGAGSQEAEAGSLLQEAGGGRSGVMPWALRWKEGVSQLCEAREAGVESWAREEGTGSADTLGVKSLWRPYVPPSRDWCVPH